MAAAGYYLNFLDVTPLPDLNAYVKAAVGSIVQTPNVTYYVDVAISNGSPSNFGTPTRVIISGLTPYPDYSDYTRGLSLAYLTGSLGKVGRLFLAWTNSNVYVGELALARDASGNISVSGMINRIQMPGSVASTIEPALAFLGQQLIMFYAHSNLNNQIIFAFCNDLDNLTFSFTAGTTEQAENGLGAAVVPGSPPVAWLAWKGYGNTDISIAVYDVANNVLVKKPPILNGTNVGPGLAYSNGQLYLAFIGTIPYLNIWPQADWFVNPTRVLPDTGVEIHICASADSKSLVLAYRDNSGQMNVMSEPG